MRAFHDSRDSQYRSPFGAVQTGVTVTLSIDIWEDRDAACQCRVWVDGAGETLLPMQRQTAEDHLRFCCDITPKEPDILWYSFLITQSDGSVRRYGAWEGRSGGEGSLYDWEPPSFQLTVYNPRPVPDWYRSAVVYQIFPDRFHRGSDWRALTEAALSQPRNGPERVLCEDWYQIPAYERDAEGRVTRWDFYGGTLSGIREKLGYLKELGVTVLYLNPIFEAASNHRYDTGDFTRIDPMLGGEEAFAALSAEAEKEGISIILDGVFNHTGCDSRYFNKYGNYDETGAWQSSDSPYRGWFRFDDSAAGYDCWWGVDDLPNVEESAPGYRDLIFRGKDSVVRKWLRAGAKGWRLDVADELPDDFIQGIKSAITDTLPQDGLLIGEVWEDASHKVSYGQLRRYLLGGELDSVMNYPLLDTLHSFLLGRRPAQDLCETLRSLQENYPPEAFFAALNLMGSHDRSRIMTVMGGAPEQDTLSEGERRDFRLSPEMRGQAKGRIWLMTLVQMTLPGVPCIYYGDEAGMEGYTDPYNRAAFPWGKEDQDLTAIYRNAISLRLMYPVFVDGSFTPLFCNDDVFGFFRDLGDEHAAVLINRSQFQGHTVTIPARGETAVELVGGHPVHIQDGRASINLSPMGSAVLFFHSGAHGLAAPMPRGAGVLCHITSLPREKGPGCIGEPAMRFIDYLAAAGQKYWQILPINPTDAFGSPYAGTSAFAANINLLPETEEELRQLFAAFQPDKGYQDFVEQNSSWLTPFSLFTALRKKFQGKMWQDWPKGYRRFQPDGIKDKDLLEEAGFQTFCQYRFHILWEETLAYAHEKGVRIIGDMPMYVSEDSADVWAEPELFTVDESGQKTMCAGVPPDYFSEEGQLWGNPLYHWSRMKEDGYDWWMRRFARMFSLYDYVRLDHFRGFESYWAVPEGKKAPAGRWLRGPGADLFRTAKERFGPLPVLAEDLGSMTPAVRGLLDQCGFPGTDVLQFSDHDPIDAYLPQPGKIAYSGTHDNQTLVGWCEDRYPDRGRKETADALVEAVLESGANVAILPLQDVLGLDDSARMNTPGTIDNNWVWQAEANALEASSEKLMALTKKAKR